jgi:hypothetical protein
VLRGQALVKEAICTSAPQRFFTALILHKDLRAPSAGWPSHSPTASRISGNRKNYFRL